MKTFKKSWKLVWFLTLSLICSATALVAQQSEQDLLAVLRSDAPKGEKAITCKKLAVYGSEASVSELAKLLPDPELSSWSRIALEAIPGSASKAALRDAASKVEGRTLIGVLNSIGVLRDGEAVPMLVAKLKSAESDVAAAAIAALGEIGNGEAAAALRSGLTTQVDAGTRGEFAQAAVVCAERLFRENNAAAATELYQQVRSADVSKQRQLEATRGLLVISGEKSATLLTECLNSSDEDLFRLGLKMARMLPGDEVSGVLSQAIRSASPERAGLVLLALADRLTTMATADQPADLSPLMAAAAEGAKPVRLSALNALGRLGNVKVLDSLMKAAAEPDSEIAATAKHALAEVPGDGVNQRIAQLLGSASGDQVKLLVELVGSRRIPATKDLQRILDSRDGDLRKAALLALGETVELKELSLLVERASAAQADTEEVAAARQALRTAAVRMPQPDACAELLARAMERAPEATQVFLIETLGEVGGRKALDSIIRFAKG
ncbi:MAG: HEAT repeat domain-containing protein, partial [Planctomycetota bacterium]